MEKKTDENRILITLNREWETSFKEDFVRDLVTFAGLSRGACVDLILKMWDISNISAITKVDKRWKEQIRREKGYAIQTIACKSSGRAYRQSMGW